jgi:hypothetical protein
MEPWTNYEQQRRGKKSRRRKLLEVTIVVYAAFAIAISSMIAEGVTIPLAARLKRKRARNQ